MIVWVMPECQPQSPAIAISRRDRMMGLAVHVFTASGAAVGLMAIAAAFARDFSTMFVWLGLALVIDGIDGTLARYARVREIAPMIDGETLDLVVDFLTYVAAPMIALWHSDLLPGAWGQGLALIVTMASALYFSDRRMKTPDLWFRGFPAIWNVEMFYLLVFRPPAIMSAFIVLGTAALMFAPVVFVHPMRVIAFRRLTLAVMVVWGAAAIAAVAVNLQPGLAVRIILLLAAAYVVLLPVFARKSPFQ